MAGSRGRPMPGMTGAADGVVMGTAQVDGRPVDLLAYDYTVYAGTQSAINHVKTTPHVRACRAPSPAGGAAGSTAAARGRTT